MGNLLLGNAEVCLYNDVNEEGVKWMKRYYKIGAAILMIGLLTVILIGCVRYRGQEKDSKEVLPKESVSQQQPVKSLYWEDRQSGIGFDYPGQFELVRKKNGAVLTKSGNQSLKVFVLLNPDLLAQDYAEVYEQMRGTRERLLSLIGDPSLKMILPKDQTRHYCENRFGTEILCVDDDVTVLREKDHQKGHLKMRYGCLEGQGVVIGYLGMGENNREDQDGEICIEMILNSIKPLKYQGSPQLMIPEDIVFEKRAFFKGEIRIPQGWREYKLSKKALCFRPDPLRGDKLAGLKIMGAIWNDRDRKAEGGFEDRLFLQDYEEVFGALALQGADEVSVKAVFYQKERKYQVQNGRDWTILKGYFSFEPQDEALYSIQNHQAMVCYSPNHSMEGTILVFLWDRRTGSFDAESIAESVLETFQ